MMRDEMAKACKNVKVGTQTMCVGRVPLTEQHLADAEGETVIAKHNDVLAEARIGCSQKCDCQSALAEFEVDPSSPTGKVVVARCSQSPASLALGQTLNS